MRFIVLSFKSFPVECSRIVPFRVSNVNSGPPLACATAAMWSVAVYELAVAAVTG